ncbi:hypothetical protein LCGC14_1509960 [marine sediment metagenome]|uniref:Uncharacterized protein n=1 Tax=marine sediment metagenome TaxID=412755 RepID=A0A0F9J1R2_9ZZZZ
MPTPEKVGEQIGKILLVTRKKSDRFFNSVQRELRKLNSLATREAARVYNRVLTSLITIEGTSVPKNDINNLSLISMLMQGIDAIQDGYRRRYSRLLQEARGDLIEITTEREFKVEKALQKIGINENRTAAGTETFELMEISNNQTLKKMNDILVKWRNFAYDTFYSGIVRGVPIAVFKSMFFNKDGSLRVGSSLDEETLYTTMTSIGEQRTSYIRGKAAELGYTYCWNANPMDPQTKSECIEATIAGVISEAEMSTGYGFPPRHICRCELVYTRPEWVNVNQGINSALEDRRSVLVQSLIDAPRQMASWKVAGKTVRSTDITRLQGNLMYKETADKLNLLADKGVVPDFNFGGYTPGGGVLSAAAKAPSSILESKSLKGITKTTELKTASQYSQNLKKRFGINEIVDESGKAITDTAILENINSELERVREMFVKGKYQVNPERSGIKKITLHRPKQGYTFPNNNGAQVMGTWHVWEVELSETLSKRGSLTAGTGDFNVGIDFSTVLRHEWGHGIGITNMNWDGKFKAAWDSLYTIKGDDYFKKYVSTYAGSNEREAFAETFAAITSSKYKVGMLPGEIEDVFSPMINLNQ